MTSQFLQRLAKSINIASETSGRYLGINQSIMPHASFSALRILFDCLFRNLTALLTHAPVVFKSEDLL